MQRDEQAQGRTFSVWHILRSYLACAGEARRLIPVQNALVILDGIIQAAVPAVLGYVVDQLITDPAHFVDHQLPWMAGVAVLGVGVFYAVAFTQHYLAKKIGHIVGIRFRKELYRHLQTLSADFYQRHHVGEIAARLTNDINVGVIPFYDRYMVTLWAFAVLVPSCVMIAWVGGYMLLLFLGMLALFLVLTRVVMPTIRRLNRQVQDEAGRINARVTEDISTAELTRVFAREEEAYHAMARHNDFFLKKALRTAKVMHLYGDVINTFVHTAAPLAMLFVGALFIGEGITVGVLVMVYGYWQRATSPVTMILNNIQQFMVCFSSMDRILEFFEEQPTIADAPGAGELTVGDGTVEVEHLSFTYPTSEGDQPALRDVSLTVPGRTSVAIIGESGAGKSTLVQLMLRLHDPQQGALRIDGQDLREVTQESLRKQIGLVMQETILLSGNVRDNLSLAHPDATDEEMVEALKNAEAWDFVQDLPQGLDTLLGERGARLSGGQRQRLAIARVFLKDPPIVIFDEATSALDTVTEKAIQTSMRRLFEGRTSIVIAHRLSTVIGCDRLVLMETGAIADQGTHRELLQKSRRYRQMCEGQLLTP
jgi:subfamily B ATP-binding cassette protein MsbA